MHSFFLFFWCIIIRCYICIDPLSFCPKASWPNVTDLSSDFRELLRLRTLLLDFAANEDILLDLLLALSWAIIFYPDMTLLQWSEFSPDIELFASLSLLSLNSQHFGDFLSKSSLETCTLLDEDLCFTIYYEIVSDATFLY